LPLLARGDLRAVKGPGLRDHRYQAFCLIAKLGWVAGSVPARSAPTRPGVHWQRVLFGEDILGHGWCVQSGGHAAVDGRVQ